MTGAPLPTATPAQARARIRRLLTDRRRGVAAVVVLTGLATAATLAGPALIGVVVDAVTGRAPGAATVIGLAALAYALLAVTGAGLQYRAGVRGAVVSESALAELRTEVFDHALVVPVGVLDAAGTGDLVARVTGDVNTLARAVRDTVPSVLFALIEVVLTLGALLLLDWRIALVALAAGSPIAVLGGRWYVRHSPARYRAERDHHGALTAGLLEAYRGWATLLSYRAGRHRQHALGVRGRATLDAELSATSARNRLRPAVSASLAAALIAVIALGTALVARDATSVGAVSAAALYVVRLFDPIGTLLEELDQIQQATAATARLVGVTRLPVHRPAPAGTGTAPASDGAGLTIEVSGVDFAYTPGCPVLTGIDVTVAAAERVVLVGASGAGKTTLATLICGTHRPAAGEIRLGGVPLDHIHPRALPRLVAMVAQEGHVFARTIADNVRLAHPDATATQVRDALVAVGALDWALALPDGLDTTVGTGHHGLTPPQAQQLGLARLVCADPAVVILDEATAELDPATAARTEHHLDAALAGRTVITIAHRLDAAARADRIVVLDAGTVIETGTHTQLITAGGAYAALWAHWTADRGVHTDRPTHPKEIP